MSRNDRRIKKWRSAGTLGELYLKEMAEQGLLLEDMTHLKYIFREDEPQHLRYRIEELEHAPTDEERAEYAKDGWQEVCHYELDYVFAKECSADEPEVSQEAVLRDLDKKIERIQRSSHDKFLCNFRNIMCSKCPFSEIFFKFMLNLC